MSALPDAQPWWRRRPARLSFRGMMVLILLLAGGLGWIVRRAHIQRDAVAAIRRGGGSVAYDWQSPGGRADTKAKPPGPGWLNAALGPDFLGSVHQVSVGPRDADAVMAHVGRLHRLSSLSFGRGNTLTDAGMAHVRGLTRLTSLIIPDSRITGAGLVHVGHLPQLRRLDVGAIPCSDDDLRPLGTLTSLTTLSLRSRITDAGLAHLGSLVNLTALSLADAPVTSAGLAHLGKMARLKLLGLGGARVADLAPIRHLPSLRTLYLKEASLDDAGLSALAAPGSLPRLNRLQLIDSRVAGPGLRSLEGLPSLSGIELSGAPITDEGLAGLAGLPRLRELVLSRTAVADPGLAILGRLSMLRTLNLSQTRVTDAGLEDLSGLKNLKNLDLKQTGTTDAGVAALRKAIPQVRVAR